MSTKLKDKEQQITQILEQLAIENNCGKPVVVEGKKDAESLKNLGVNGEIIFAKAGGRNLLDVISEVEAASAGEVILMLDFDRRGRELTLNLKGRLEESGIKVNIHFWLKIQCLAGKEVKDVEGLASYMETLKSKIGNS
ncbi:MAG: toprim domain-containing protein [Candidatus Bathyarchaeia archaeon]